MLNRAMRDPASKAIMATRGGYGAMRILDRLDYPAARGQPKLLIGFSDITALHLALYRHAGAKGISGPLVTDFAKAGPRAQARFLALVRGEVPPPLDVPGAMRTGLAEGPLLAGNLAVLVRLVGTPFLPALEGAILVVEEVHEAPYRIDALFAQLRLAGLLQRLGGLVLGAFTGWEPRNRPPTRTPADIFADYFGDAPYPVATGLHYGHFPSRLPLGIGARVRLEVTTKRGTLTMLEPICE